MALPDPRPGLVIRYAYLWRAEEARGREEGAKDRPCAIVLAVKRAGDSLSVVVAPITHAPPRDPRVAIAIPPAVKRRLGLDQEPSWIITNEVNVFDWPGPDLRPIDPGDRTLGFAFGYLPAGLTTAMITSVRQQLRDGRTRIVRRDDPDPAA